MIMRINTSKTKELVIGPWGHQHNATSLQTDSGAVERVHDLNCWEYMSTQLCLGPLWLSGLNHRLGHSACWPDGLMALAGLGSNPGLEGSFSARLDLRACYEIKFSDRHRKSACVLSKL